MLKPSVDIMPCFSVLARLALILREWLVWEVQSLNPLTYADRYPWSGYGWIVPPLCHYSLGRTGSPLTLLTARLLYFPHLARRGLEGWCFCLMPAAR